MPRPRKAHDEEPRPKSRRQQKLEDKLVRGEFHAMARGQFRDRIALTISALERLRAGLDRLPPLTVASLGVQLEVRLAGLESMVSVLDLVFPEVAPVPAAGLGEGGGIA